MSWRPPVKPSGKRGPALERDTRLTPRHLFAEIEVRYLGGQADLDAFATAETALAPWYYDGATAETDGYTAPWSLAGPGPLARDILSVQHAAPTRVFANPPWRRIQPAVEHAIREVDAGRVAVVAFLVPARTTTEWWAMLQRAGAQLETIRGRVEFAAPGAKRRPGAFEHTVVWVLREPFIAQRFA